MVCTMGYNSISGFSKSSHLIFPNILCVANNIQRGVDAFKIKECTCRDGSIHGDSNTVYNNHTFSGWLK